MHKFEQVLEIMLRLFTYYKLAVGAFIFISVGAFLYPAFFGDNMTPKEAYQKMTPQEQQAFNQKYKAEFFDEVKKKDSNFSKLMFIVESGIDVNTRDEKRRTPIFYATINKNAEVVRYLIHKKASINAIDLEGMMPIDYLDKEKDSALYMTFVDTALINKAQKEGYKRVTVSHSTDKNGKIFSTKVAGEQQTSWSPLMLAIKNFDNDEVRKFITHADYLESKTNNGSTPIYFAINFNNNEALDMLLDAGVNIEHFNNFNVNVLAYAIIKDNMYALKALVKKGANIHKKVNRVRTPIALAKVNHRDNIEDYLEDIGAS